MNAPLQQQAVDSRGIPVRPFSDFLTFVRNYIVPKGAIVLFYGTIPKSGWLECDGLNDTPTITAPTGFVYGIKT